METNYYPNKIIGIDFSGAKDAGKKMWIAEGTIEKDSIYLKDCFQARDLPNSGVRLELCLASLFEYIKGQDWCIIGFDFPFSIPEEMIAQDTWEEFILEFPNVFSEPDDFREHCRQIFGKPERKRKTEKENNAPFAAYNLRLYKQTHYGIRNILNPLLKDKAVSVLPMQRVQKHKPWIVEICPRSTLIPLGLDLPYKGINDLHKENRKIILDYIENNGFLQNVNEYKRDLIINNTGGDCLDSIIAMVAVFRSINNAAFFTMGKEKPYKKEGYIYV